MPANPSAEFALFLRLSFASSSALRWSLFPGDLDLCGLVEEEEAGPGLLDDEAEAGSGGGGVFGEEVDGVALDARKVALFCGGAGALAVLGCPKRFGIAGGGPASKLRERVLLRGLFTGEDGVTIT